MMKRREFLGTSLTALAWTQFPSIAWSLKTQHQWLLVGRSNRSLAGASLDRAGTPVPSILEVYDHRFQLLQTVQIPFIAHSWAQNRKSPHLAYGFSKWGNEAGIVDLKARRFTALLEREPHKRFFGHGLALADGRMLLSMRNDQTKKAELVFYKDLKPTGTIELGASYAHELRFAPQDSNLVVAAAGNREKSGQIAWVDVREKKIVREMNSGFQLPAHFRFLGADDQKILVLGIANKPAIEIIEGKTAHYLESEAPFTAQKGNRPESLNAVLDPQNSKIAWVAVYGGSVYLKVDTTAKKIVETVASPGARHAFGSDGRMYLGQISETLADAHARLQTWNSGWKPLDPPAEIGNSSHVDGIQPVP